MIKKFKQYLFNKITFLPGILIVGLLIMSVHFVSAWTSPSAAPTLGNIAKLINVGLTAQTKLGALGIGGLFETENNTFLSTLAGKLGIGTTTPAEKLTLDGGNFLHTAGDPKTGVKVTNQDYMYYARDAAIFGSYAYVIGPESNSLAVLDVSNPKNPLFKIGIADSNSFADPKSVAISYPYAYVAGDCSSSLVSVDISDPLNPEVAGGVLKSSFSDIDMFSPYSISIFGKYAYVTSECSDSLLVLDIDTNPLSPTVVAGVKDSTYMDSPKSVVATTTPFGDYAYVTGYNSDSLAVININNPESPFIEGGVTDSTYMNGANYVLIYDNYAYVTGYNSDSLAVIDISDPVNLDSGDVTGIIDENYLNGAFTVSATSSSSKNYAYVTGNRSDSLAIVDITDPTDPQLKGGLINTMEEPTSVFVSGTYNDTLAIVNISTPASPQIVGRIASSTVMDEASSVYVLGDYAYVTGYRSDSLAVVNISIPSNPQIVGSVKGNNKLNGASSVFATTTPSGNYAYVASYVGDSLTVVDISTPSNPIVGKEVSTPELVGAQSVFVSGNYAYVASYDDYWNIVGDFSILDITTLDDPLFVNSIASSTAMGKPSSVYVSDNYAYVTGKSSNSLVAIDITNPASLNDDDIVGVAKFSSSYTPNSVFVSGDYAYVARYQTLIQVNISDPENLDDSDIVGTAASSNYMKGGRSVYISGNYAYVAGSHKDYPGSLAVVDISGGRIISNSDVIGGATDNEYLDGPRHVSINGRYAYVTSWISGSSGYLSVIDIINPLFPNPLGKAQDGGKMDRPEFVTLYGSYAYVASNQSNSLAVVDISDPPSLSDDKVLGGAASSSIMYDASSVAISHPYAYVAGPVSDSLAVVDISAGIIDDDDIKGGLQNSGYINNANSISISGNYAYVASRNSDSLAVVDISDPTNPQLTGGIKNSSYMDGANSVYVSYPYAYVSAKDSDSLAVVNISDPYNPQLTGGVKSSTYMDQFATQYSPGSRSVHVSGNYAYVTGNYSDSLAIIDISDPVNLDSSDVTGIIDSTYLNVAYSVFVSGKYAYVTSNFNSNEGNLIVVDVSDPLNPYIIGTLIDSNTTNDPSSVFISGKYAYITDSKFSHALSIIDISGIDSPSALIGSISTGNLNVAGNMDIGNNLYTGRAANVGLGGVLSAGVIQGNELKVLNYLKANPTDTPPTCGASMKGAMYYDDSLNKPCYCNGTAPWQQFNDHSTCE
jgi:hypothetical protein